MVVGALVLELLVIVLGLVQFFDAHTITTSIHLGSAPTWSGLIFALTITTIAFTSVESASGLAGEVRASRGALKRLLVSGTVLVLVAYVGIAIVAVTAFPVHGTYTALGHRFLNDPVIGIVTRLHPHGLAQVLKYAMGAVAAATLIAAANSAMLGLSRLAYSLSTNRQIPSGLGRLHSKRSTPYVLIVLAGVLAAALVVPENLDFLVGIYAFGAMLAFTIAHLSICRLRYSEPDRRRPFRMPLSVTVRGGELPLLAALGALLSGAGWVALIVVHQPARYVGLGWMAVGLTLYVVYRRSDESSLLRRVTVSPEMLRAEQPRERDYGSILVPLFGTRARRRHRADRGAARRGRADRRGGDRHRDDRGGVGLRDADVAAARRAPARRAGQARPPGARAGEDRGGGVHRGARRDRDRARAPRGPRDRRGGAPPRRRGDRARRRGALSHPRRCAAGGPWGAAWRTSSGTSSSTSSRRPRAA